MTAPVIEDTNAVRTVLQRLCSDGKPLELAYQANRGETVILAEDGRYLFLRMDPTQIPAWGLKAGEKVSLKLEDRGLKFSTVVVESTRTPFTDSSRFR